MQSSTGVSVEQLIGAIAAMAGFIGLIFWRVWSSTEKLQGIAQKAWATALEETGKRAERYEDVVATNTQAMQNVNLSLLSANQTLGEIKSQVNRFEGVVDGNTAAMMAVTETQNALGAALISLDRQTAASHKAMTAALRSMNRTHDSLSKCWAEIISGAKPGEVRARKGD